MIALVVVTPSMVPNQATVLQKATWELHAPWVAVPWEVAWEQVVPQEVVQGQHEQFEQPSSSSEPTGGRLNYSILTTTDYEGGERPLSMVAGPGCQPNSPLARKWWHWCNGKKLFWVTLLICLLSVLLKISGPSYNLLALKFVGC